MIEDKTAPIAAIGFFASLTLAEINLVVSIAAGLATLGYVVTKWVLLLRARSRRPASLEPDRLR